MEEEEEERKRNGLKDGAPVLWVRINQDRLTAGRLNPDRVLNYGKIQVNQVLHKVTYLFPVISLIGHDQKSTVVNQIAEQVLKAADRGSL